MKRLCIAILLFSFSTLFFACDDDGLGDGKWAPLLATNLGDQADLGTVNGGLYNGDMEIINSIDNAMPGGWRDLINAFNAPNNYSFNYSEITALDEYSAEISASKLDDPNEYGFFIQNILNPDVPPGTFIRLRGSVKTTNLSGNGFNMAMIGYDIAGNQVFGAETFASSRFVSGTTDWTEYVTGSEEIPVGVVEIRVILAIGRSTIGNVFFDNIVLEVD